MRLTYFGHASILIDTGHETILIDPWLTQRLDGFWEKWPPISAGMLEVLVGGVDHLVFSHHHLDHHHYPSLRLLRDRMDADIDEASAWHENVHCVWPRTGRVPRFTASGLGHQAIGWTLRRLGFTAVDAIQPGDTVQLGTATVRTYVSGFPFPEVSLLIEGSDATVMVCGDALLHEDTVRAFTSPEPPHVDLAFVPAQSLHPPGVLTERRQVAEPKRLRARAIANFDRYVSTLNARVTVPSAFGWRVHGQFSWCNRALFPFTPWAALGRLTEMGRAGRLWGPGQQIVVEGGDVEVVAGPARAAPYDFEAVYREMELDPAHGVPAFAPDHDRAGVQKTPTDDLVAQVMDALVGTDFWYQAVENGSTHRFLVTEDAGTTRAYVLDPGGGRVLPAAATDEAAIHAGVYGYTHLAGSTLQALFDSELMFSSAYGLWVSDSNLLSSVFHQPIWYVRHLERALAEGTSP